MSGNVADKHAGTGEHMNANDEVSSINLPVLNPIDDDVAERAAKRQAAVNPILQRKGWKPGRLVTEAGVGKNSVYEYLDGTRANITEANRKAIAEALDLRPEELPD